ncbi:MAG: glycosyltransferase family 2 protein, partial [Culicoidibacterales bacterium]
MAYKISIITASYNAEDFLNDYFLSFCGMKNTDRIELIYIIDGSTDSTVDKVEAWKLPFNIKLINNHINNGLSASRNQALDLATGDYVMFLDADDWLDRGAIDLLLSIIEKHEWADIILFEQKKEISRISTGI